MTAAVSPRPQKQTVAQRSAFFEALASGSKSGLDNLQICQLLPVSDVVKSTISKRLQSGSPFSHIFQKLALISSNESQLLQIGEHTGKQGFFYQILAQYYQSAQTRYLHVRSQLLYPIALVSLALLLAILLSVVRSDGAAFMLVVTGILWFMFCRSVLGYFKYAQYAAWSGWKLKLANSKSRNHLLGKIVERDFLMMFFTMYQAGVDYLSALGKLGVILGGVWRKQCEDAASRIRQGEGLVNTLRDSGLVLSQTNLQFIRIADHSGKLLPESRRLIKEMSEAIDSDVNFYLTWAGRLSYLLALTIVAGFIF